MCTDLLLNLKELFLLDLGLDPEIVPSCLQPVEVFLLLFHQRLELLVTAASRGAADRQHCLNRGLGASNHR